jgi:hypothetical protein
MLIAPGTILKHQSLSKVTNYGEITTLFRNISANKIMMRNISVAIP